MIELIRTRALTIFAKRRHFPVAMDGRCGFNSLVACNRMLWKDLSAFRRWAGNLLKRLEDQKNEKDKLFDILRLHSPENTELVYQKVSTALKGQKDENLNCRGTLPKDQWLTDTIIATISFLLGKNIHTFDGRRILTYYHQLTNKKVTDNQGYPDYLTTIVGTRFEIPDGDIILLYCRKTEHYEGLVYSNSNITSKKRKDPNTSSVQHERNTSSKRVNMILLHIDCQNIVLNADSLLSHRPWWSIQRLRVH